MDESQSSNPQRSQEEYRRRSGSSTPTAGQRSIAASRRPQSYETSPQQIDLEPEIYTPTQPFAYEDTEGQDPWLKQRPSPDNPEGRQRQSPSPPGKGKGKQREMSGQSRGGYQYPSPTGGSSQQYQYSYQRSKSESEQQASSSAGNQDAYRRESTNTQTSTGTTSTSTSASVTRQGSEEATTATAPTQGTQRRDRDKRTGKQRLVSGVFVRY
ncbi:hypothetical protein PV11_00180 [Exophiala sideris]|uniref:Uncharacterized protein n=1 Tax=Exophiala sideris TaxID=1016849 RepID=A0A0D1YNE3_9EURO|nr:hypothetical protein PV11_00180 [Exophiala sideris]